MNLGFPKMLLVAGAMLIVPLIAFSSGAPNPLSRPYIAEYHDIFFALESFHAW